MHINLIKKNYPFQQEYHAAIKSLPVVANQCAWEVLSGSLSPWQQNIKCFVKRQGVKLKKLHNFRSDSCRSGWTERFFFVFFSHSHRDEHITYQNWKEPVCLHVTQVHFLIARPLIKCKWTSLTWKHRYKVSTLDRRITLT